MLFTFDLRQTGDVVALEQSMQRRAREMRDGRLQRSGPEKRMKDPLAEPVQRGAVLRQIPAGLRLLR